MILDVTLIDLNAKSYADMWSFSKKMRKPKVNHKFYKLNWKKSASFRPQWYCHLIAKQIVPLILTTSCELARPELTIFSDQNESGIQPTFS